MMTFASSVFGW